MREFHLAFYAVDFGYFGRIPPRPVENVGLLLAVVVLALIYFALFRAVNAIRNVWVGRGLMLLTLVLGLVALGAASSEAITYFYPDASLYLHIPLPLIVLAGCTAFAYSKRFSLTAIFLNFRRVAFIAAPFGLVLCAEDALMAFGSEPPQPERPVIERPAVKNADSRVKNRVIWIIYDELGQAPLMTRPADVKMPAFDRLMSESFVAENAFPPNYYTRHSIIALLTGLPLTSASPVSERDLKLTTTANGPTRLLSETENVLKDAKALGGNVAIEGWYEPYTRLFEKELSYGHPPLAIYPPCPSVAECAVDIFTRSFESVPYFGRLMMANPSLNMGGNTTSQIERNSYLQARAQAAAQDPNIDLCYFHFSIPHSPFITKTDEPAKRGYYDSLEAVDRSFGELRQRLETAGLWDSTTIIVSADHWWRLKGRGDFAQLPEAERSAAVNDTRVPFIVKLPGQKSMQSYAPAFNTVLTRYIIRAIMSGEVNNSAELSGWLDRMAIEQPDLVNFRYTR